MDEHIVNFSGGKDSTAMLLRMLEENMQVDRVIFADVGEDAEFEETYEFIEKVEKYIGMPIEKVKSEKWTWDKIFFGYPGKGNNTNKIRGFPCASSKGCKYSGWLKREPLRKAHGKENIIYIGISVNEIKRINSKQYQNRTNIFKFPLVSWNMTETDCWKYCKDRGMLNPLYKYFNRLGCWQCPKHSLKELRNLYNFYPEKWAKLRIYQEACDWKFRPDYSVFELEERFKKEGYQLNIFE